MQRNLERRWNKAFKQLIHLFLRGIIQRWKVGASDLRIGDDDDFGNVIDVRIPLHFHHA
jgi:hypothetical protein